MRLYKVKFDSIEEGRTTTYVDCQHIIGLDVEEAIRKAKAYCKKNKLKYLINSVEVIAGIDIK